FEIEDRIVHAVDDGTLGFIRVHSGNVYVTPNSYIAPNTTVANIQRGVNAAQSGDTIYIENGSYVGDIDAATGANAGKNVTLSPETRTGSNTAQVTNQGSLVLDAGDALNLQVNGVSASTDYDNFVITGGVTLNNATLLTSGTITTGTTDIVLIDNDLGDAVVGTFFGLPEGATVTINGIDFRITYVGGDGNDVVLTTQVTADTSVTIVGGNLTITDI